MIFLIIINLAGNIERVPMKSQEACAKAAQVFNIPTNARVVVAYCIKDE